MINLISPQIKDRDFSSDFVSVVLHLSLQMFLLSSFLSLFFFNVHKFRFVSGQDKNDDEIHSL